MTALTLLLTPWMMPHKVISWQTAVTMSFLGKVEVIEEYDDEIRSPSVSIKHKSIRRRICINILKPKLMGIGSGGEIDLFTPEFIACIQVYAKSGRPI